MYPKLKSNERLSYQVADHVMMLIQDGQLKPGEKLPSEQELTQLFGVSRPTIREAIRSLVSRHVLKVIHGRGTYVAENPGVKPDPLGLNTVPPKELLDSLAETRRIFEPGVARLAAENADDEDLEAIEANLRAMERIVRGHNVSMSIELEFHRSIANASKNVVIMRVIPIIMESIIRTYEQARRTSDEHATALEEHRRIVDAIRRGSGVEAEQAMQEHLRRSLARTRAKEAAQWDSLNQDEAIG
jgi:GntR family transcriptional regulator, transcriptional repressor for pyruvate dehydrogenase complex